MMKGRETFYGQSCSICSIKGLSFRSKDYTKELKQISFLAVNGFKKAKSALFYFFCLFFIPKDPVFHNLYQPFRKRIISLCPVYL